MEKLKNLTMEKIVAFVTLILLVCFVSVSYFGSSKAAVSIQPGNILDGKNLTTNQSTYSDPISATSGQRVRLNTVIWNQGSDPATNTLISFNLSNPQQPSATISADGGVNISDVAVIDPGGAVLTFVPGSAKLYGPNCAS